jgi:tRNA pseudouridine32 synthase/23S rRNA pseudouridine746 synthase
MSALVCLFKDKNIYAIHKPQKVPFHSLDESTQRDQELVHVEGIISQAKKFLNDDNIYPVHRLDRMTSGIMIFARSKEANSALSKLFLEKKVEKYYLALSEQKPKKKQGAIIGDMAKARSGSYLLKRSCENPAITRFFAQKINQNHYESWFFILKPETGKTHQLRVAMKSLGSPVLGDTRYSGKTASRGYLHAYKIRFDLLDKRYEIIDPYFKGEEFDLDQYNLATSSGIQSPGRNSHNFLKPELLLWPKSSFQLSEDS